MDEAEALNAQSASAAAAAAKWKKEKKRKKNARDARKVETDAPKQVRAALQPEKGAAKAAAAVPEKGKGDEGTEGKGREGGDVDAGVGEGASRDAAAVSGAAAPCEWGLAGSLLDGFPVTKAQADALLRYGVQPDVVIVLGKSDGEDAPAEEEQEVEPSLRATRLVDDIRLLGLEEGAGSWAEDGEVDPYVWMWKVMRVHMSHRRARQAVSPSFPRTQRL
jgi:hypothetical protein